jgi:hypothetical protein
MGPLQKRAIHVRPPLVGCVHCNAGFQQKNGRALRSLGEDPCSSAGRYRGLSRRRSANGKYADGHAQWVTDEPIFGVAWANPCKTDLVDQ